MRYSVPRKSRRVPLVTPVHLKLEELADPVTERSLNISLGGMSVAIERPAGVGSLVAFEFDIGDALVEGTGEVVWSREQETAGDRPAGMGIRFRYLSPGSRERIFRLVQWYANQDREVTPEEVAAAAAGGLPGAAGLRSPQTSAATEEDASAAPPAASPAAAEPPLPAAEPPLPAAEPPLPAAEPELPAAAEPSAELAAPGPEPAELPAQDQDDDEEPFTATIFEPPPVPAAEPFPETPTVRLSEAPHAPSEPARWSSPWPEAEAVQIEEPPDLPEIPSAVQAPPPTPSVPAASPPAEPTRPVSGSAYSRGAGHSDRLRWGAIALAALVAALLVAVVLFHEPLLRWVEASRGGQGAPTATPEAPPAPVAEEAEAGAEIEELAPVVERATEPAAAAPAVGDEAAIEAEVEPDAAATAPPSGAVAPPAAVTAPTGEPESPAAAAIPPEAASAPSARPAGPLRNVEVIRWERAGGSTLVTIEGDGSIPVRGYSVARLAGGNPRLLLRLRGVVKPYAPATVRAGSPELRGIRSGLHVRPGAPELHVVLDLASTAVQHRIEETANGLRIHLSLPTG